VVDDDTRNTAAADTVQVSAAEPAAVDSVSYNNSNAMSVPSYQYDSAGMTELSLVTDEVRKSGLLAKCRVNQSTYITCRHILLLLFSICDC